MKCKVPGHNSSLFGIGKRVHRAPVSPICLGFLLRLLENDHTFLEELLGPPSSYARKGGGCDGPILTWQEISGAKAEQIPVDQLPGER